MDATDKQKQTNEKLTTLPHKKCFAQILVLGNPRRAAASSPTSYAYAPRGRSYGGLRARAPTIPGAPQVPPYKLWTKWTKENLYPL